MQADILAFWFGPTPGAPREEWFRKDPAFDALIRERFGRAIQTALAGGYREWEISAQGSLARILLLDQFTRNVFRDTPCAFAGDAAALETAERAVARGADRELLPVERQFLYLPFEHAESPAAQERCIALCTRLAEETGFAAPLEWARKHAAIIARFGRYPHRNAILGRPSTDEELAFLAQPGSRF